MNEGSRKTIAAALVANLGIAVAKFVAYLATGASAMLAESVHSLADTGNQALLLLGGALARRDPTPEHPFGYGRERYFWSFVVALVLFSLGSLFAVTEGAVKLRDPHPLESPLWAVGVLVVALGLESFSMATAVREANSVRGVDGWWSFVRRSRSPELPVVLLEDFGALLGLAIALAGVGLAIVLDDARFDAFATIAIGILLGAIAIVLAIEMKSLLIGEGATAEKEERIRAAIERAPRVSRLIHMRTLHLGPEELLVAAKVEFAPQLSVAGLASAIDAVECDVRGEVPSARLIYIEPDVHRECAADPEE